MLEARSSVVGSARTWSSRAASTAAVSPEDRASERERASRRDVQRPTACMSP